MTGAEATVAKPVAQTVAKVATQNPANGQGLQSPLQGGGDSPFTDLLKQHEVNMDASKADILKAFGYETNAHPADNAVSAKHVDMSVTEVSDVNQLESIQATDKLASMLSNLNHGGLQMNKMMEMVTSGAKFSNRELLLLQGAMHQLTFEAEIAVRSMDAFKSVIQTLIQRTTQ